MPPRTRNTNENVSVLDTMMQSISAGLLGLLNIGTVNIGAIYITTVNIGAIDMVKTNIGKIYIGTIDTGAKDIGAKISEQSVLLR